MRFSYKGFFFNFCKGNKEKNPCYAPDIQLSVQRFQSFKFVYCRFSAFLIPLMVNIDATYTWSSRKLKELGIY